MMLDILIAVVLIGFPMAFSCFVMYYVGYTNGYADGYKAKAEEKGGCVK